MSDLSIPPININNTPIDVYSLHHILASDALTAVQKVNFLKRHSTEVKGIMEIELGTEDFNRIMSNRPLMIFRPIKNVFTKNGDRILLAKTLEIPLNEMDDFVRKATHALPNSAELALYSKGQLDAVKTYIFRHGSKEQVIKFLDYELSHSKDIKKTLRKTFEYTTGGVADYFARPIHRMDNKTFVGLFETVIKNLEAEKEADRLTEEETMQLSKACLARIYQLQENSKFRNSARTKREIESKMK
ncbi:MAG: hypothetical protein K6A44_06990 [bacterium]|nr:hypothetical protein [bacterium]